MKRILAIFLVSVLAVLSLCACSSEPVSYTVDGMTYSLPGDLTLEEDKDVAMQNLSDLLDDDIAPSKEAYLESLRDIKYYYHNGYEMSVTSELIPYNNNEIDSFFSEGASPGYREEYTDFSIDGIQGKQGYYSQGSGSDSTKTNAIYLLNDGILYSFDIYMLTDDELPEGFMDDIIDSISFADDYIGSKNISCEDIQLEIPDNYQALDFETTEGYYDEHWFGQFGDIRTEFGVFYMLLSDYPGANYSSFIEVFPEAYGFETYDRSSSDCELGTCDFISGVDSDGMSHILAFLDYNGKIYVFILSGTEDTDTQHLIPITSSVTAK